MDSFVGWFQEEQEGPALRTWFNIWETNLQEMELQQQLQAQQQLRNNGNNNNNGGNGGGGGQQIIVAGRFLWIISNHFLLFPLCQSQSLEAGGGLANLAQSRCLVNRFGSQLGSGILSFSFWNTFHRAPIPRTNQNFNLHFLSIFIHFLLRNLNVIGLGWVFFVPRWMSAFFYTGIKFASCVGPLSFESKKGWSSCVLEFVLYEFNPGISFQLSVFLLCWKEFLLHWFDYYLHVLQEKISSFRGDIKKLYIEYWYNQVLSGESFLSSNRRQVRRSFPWYFSQSIITFSYYIPRADKKKDLSVRVGARQQIQSLFLLSIFF